MISVKEQIKYREWHQIYKQISPDVAEQIVEGVWYLPINEARNQIWDEIRESLK